MRAGDRSIPQAPGEGQRAAAEAVWDRYRCPKEFLDFRLCEGIPTEPRVFQFGAATTCYGRCLNGFHPVQPGSSSRDALEDVSMDGKQLLLPFDPNEVLDNLRFELYPSVQLGQWEHTLKRIYYSLRPFTSRKMRKYIQKLRAASWQRIKFPQWPVDTAVESICENLLRLSLQASGVSRIPFIWFWPQGARGCVAMTHDVETAAGVAFCKELMDIDDSFGIKASFQIVPESRYTVTPEFLNDLRTRGFEVCVQDLNHDGRLFDEREEFLRRVSRINRYGLEFGATGYRSAVLYRKPEWYKDLHFSFDMSFPNVAHLDPQRGGCCTVMPYFIGEVLELPLTTIQDYSLFHVLGEYSIELWETQLKMILAKNGLATFIVHPDYIMEAEPRAVYERLLSRLAELRQSEALWFALPGEVDRWWRQRRAMSLVAEGESWRIVGEGSERATLAFAKLVEGRLVYELASAPKGEMPGPVSRVGQDISLQGREQ